MTFHRVKKAKLVYLCAICSKWHLSKVGHGEGKAHTSDVVGVVR